ncbi:MAG TPA: hypothetical protein VN282_09645 [Pyrinomonadaceae bacterium]|nr:hypothetical protein [Pyrinomonadaceae bacterium]
MKIPFDFGIKLIFRLLFPGVILTLGFLPLIRAVVSNGGWDASLEYVLGFTVVFLGWLITVSDMPIYIIFEGRRYWPGPLFKFFLWREQRRLARHLAVVKPHETGVLNLMRIYVARRQAEPGGTPVAGRGGRAAEKLDLVREAVGRTDKGLFEAYFDLRTFPLDGKGYEEYRAVRPTRLGNLMAAYERYSTRAYGMDAVFYWYRIWVTLDKDTRGEIDDAQALADSTVYTSFALYCSGLLWAVYAASAYARAPLAARLPWVASALPAAPATVFDRLPGPGLSLLVAAGFVAAGFAVYRIALRLHAQYGELFKAMFDMYAPKVTEKFQKEVFEELDDLLGGAPSAEKLKGKDVSVIVTRYLQYNRIRCPYTRVRGGHTVKCDRTLRPSEAKEHYRRVHPDQYPDGGIPQASSP